MTPLFYSGLVRTALEKKMTHTPPHAHDVESLYIILPLFEFSHDSL